MSCSTFSGNDHTNHHLTEVNRFIGFSYNADGQRTGITWASCVNGNLRWGYLQAQR